MMVNLPLSGRPLEVWMDRWTLDDHYSNVEGIDVFRMDFSVYLYAATHITM